MPRQAATSTKHYSFSLNKSYVANSRSAPSSRRRRRRFSGVGCEKTEPGYVVFRSEFSVVTSVREYRSSRRRRQCKKHSNYLRNLQKFRKVPSVEEMEI